MAEDKNKKTQLEEIGDKQRMELTLKNKFSGVSESSTYSAMSTYALSDEETPIHGKGTGSYMDVYGGGGEYDINGDGKTPGSGRNGNLSFNTYKIKNTYERPNMDDLGDEK